MNPRSMSVCRSFTHGVSHVETGLTPLDAALDRRVEDAHVGALEAPVTMPSNSSPIRSLRGGRGRLAQQALDFCAVFFLCARRQRGERHGEGPGAPASRLERCVIKSG
jgi:hypothetical protein